MSRVAVLAQLGLTASSRQRSQHFSEAVHLRTTLSSNAATCSPERAASRPSPERASTLARCEGR
eukprot:6875292-Pyramimonas_sp.AAC.1